MRLLDHGEIDRARSEAGDEIGRCRTGERDLDLRIGHGEGLDHGGDAGADQVIGQTEADLAGNLARRHFRPDVVIERDEPSALGEQPLARRGEPEAAPVTLEKSRPQHGFEPLDLLAHGTLRQIADIRCRRHVGMVRRGDEGADEVNVEIAGH